MRRIRHKKRGTTYDVIGDGFVQTDVALHDYDRVTVYRATNPPYDEELVIRRADEMLDGRFEELPFKLSDEFWVNAIILFIGAAIVLGIFID